MWKALSLDLRIRVLAVVSGGASDRVAAVRFGVSAASVSRWRKLEREKGEVTPGILGGDRRSGRVEEQHDLIRRLLAEKPDISTNELQATLQALGHDFGYDSLWRFFKRHGLTRKKGRPRQRAGPPRPYRRSAINRADFRLLPYSFPPSVIRTITDAFPKGDGAANAGRHVTSETKAHPAEPVARRYRRQSRGWRHPTKAEMSSASRAGPDRAEAMRSGA